MTRRAAGLVLVAVTGVLVALLVPEVRAFPDSTYGGGRTWLLAAVCCASLGWSLLAWWTQAPIAALAGVAWGWLLLDLPGVVGLPWELRTLTDAALLALPAAVLAAFGVARAVLLGAAAAAAVAAVSRTVAVDPFTDPDCWRGCAHNPLLVDALTPVGGAGLVLGAAGVAASCLYSLVSSARSRAGTPGDRQDRPVLLLGIGAATLLALLSLTSSVGVTTGTSAAYVAGLTVVQALALGAGTVAGGTRLAAWWRRRRLAAVADQLRSAQGPDVLRDGLRRALRDPDLDVSFWAPARSAYVDAVGQPLDLRTEGRTSTTITRHGHRLALVAHAEHVTGTRLQEVLGPTLRLALENEQLRAAALAELDELTQSRRRLLARAEAERRGLERNLHDGAQQRVVSLVLLVRLLGEVLARDGGGPAVAATVRRADTLVRATMDELRRVAHGLYPAVLVDVGLAGAVWDLADEQDDVAVVVGDLPEARLPGPVEMTAYLVVAAGVEDAVRRGAREVRVDGRLCDDWLRLVVADDGAPQEVDTDHALADQVGALGGALDVGPRRIEVGLPCAS